MKIVFITADTVKEEHLDTDEEYRAVHKAVLKKFDLVHCAAARLEDLTEVLSNELPDIVHFSAHGEPLGRILLKSRAGKAAPVNRKAFLQLFSAFRDNIRLVVLNACNSLSYAKALSQTVDCVFGVKDEIDDTVAIDFAREFYRALVDGQAVQIAYARAEILLTNQGIREQNRPRPCWRRRVKGSEIRFFLAPAGQSPAVYSTTASQFDLDVARFGVSADLLRVRKECLPDGSSRIHYSVQGLKAHVRALTGFHFYLRSTVGCAGKPKLEKSSRAIVEWKPEKISAASSPGNKSAGASRAMYHKMMERLMDHAGKVRGVFHFRVALKPKKSYSFGWSIRVLNSDAVTKWEFYHLYREQERRHVDKTKFDTPTEYLSRAVWFPIKQLELSVIHTDHKDRETQVSCFALKGAPPVPPEEVVYGGGIVRIYPNTDSKWSKRNFKWEPDLDRQNAAAGTLDTSEEEHATVVVDSPPVGSALAIDWSLPASAPDEDFDRLVEDAEKIRRALLRHRKQRVGRPLRKGAPDRLFSEFYQEVAGDCGLKSGHGDFEVAFMTYRNSDARLVMVDGRTNGNVMSRNLWEFWLPFGMGLAGACFRAGNKLFGYLRPREEDTEREEYYLKIPGYEPHACLLALPIDHPQFKQPPELDDRAPIPERCRQLIGVMTIGSTSLSAEMSVLCKQKLSKTEFERLVKLRQRCQKFGNDLCQLLHLP